MNAQSASKLDNPVWYALSETHRDLAIDFGDIKFYQPDYCPFGGFTAPGEMAVPISEYAALAGSFFIIGDKPALPEGYVIKNELVCLQMVASHKIDVEIRDDITGLTEEHAQALFALVNLVQPGYFKNKTALLGSYYGIFKNGELVAVTGERMKMDEFTEVSAVCTHPAHVGNGYAKQLVAHTANQIFAQQKTPCLHVVESNPGAIRLYERLGFKTRRKMSFWSIGAEVFLNNFGNQVFN